jgi:dimethylglycine dehydrogenase
MLEIQAGQADAYADECILKDGQTVGRVTSGGFGHRVGKSLAMGYVRTDLACPGQNLEVEILDEKRPAVVVKSPVYDPENKLLRS